MAIKTVAHVGFGSIGWYWTKNQATNSRAFAVMNMSGAFTVTTMEKNAGFGIRCVRDLNK